MQRCKAAPQAPRILPPRADEPHRRNNRSHYGNQRDLSATQSNLVETNHRPRISPAVRNTPTEIPYPPPERPKPAVNDESCALLCLPTPNAVPRRWQRCTPAAPPCRKEVAAFGDCQPSANAKPSKQARICFWLCNDTARASRFEQNHSLSHPLGRKCACLYLSSDNGRIDGAVRLLSSLVHI